MKVLTFLIGFLGVELAARGGDDPDLEPDHIAPLAVFQPARHGFGVVYVLFGTDNHQLIRRKRFDAKIGGLAGKSREYAEFDRAEQGLRCAEGVAEFQDAVRRRNVVSHSCHCGTIPANFAAVFQASISSESSAAKSCGDPAFGS